MKDPSACVLPEEPLEKGGEDGGLVDGDERRAVIDPDELGVLEVLRKALGVLRRHRLVLSGPHHEHLSGEGALLRSPVEKLRPRRDARQVLVEIAADLRVATERREPSLELILGNALLRKGAERDG